jgi:hypothetical protein
MRENPTKPYSEGEMSEFDQMVKTKCLKTKETEKPYTWPFWGVPMRGLLTGCRVSVGFCTSNENNGLGMQNPTEPYKTLR